MKSKRGWMETQNLSGSYYSVDVGDNPWGDGLDLTLGDCHRKITWTFGRPGNKRAVRKIKKLKKLVDEIYEYLVPENQR